jgi:hypothetical protein
MVEWRGAAVGLGLRIRFTYNSALLPNLCSFGHVKLIQPVTSTCYIYGTRIKRGEVNRSSIALDCSLLPAPSFGSPSPQGRTRMPHSITPCRVLLTLYRNQHLSPLPCPSNNYPLETTHLQVWSKANPPPSHHLHPSDSSHPESPESKGITFPNAC